MVREQEKEHNHMVEVAKDLLDHSTVEMVAAEEALAAQEVKVLVLLGTVDYRPSKGPRRETG